MFTSAIVILVCIVISFYSKENIEALKMTLEMVAEVYDSTVIGFLMTTFIVIFLEIVFALFSGYLGIIIGHRSNNMKIIKSIVCGMVVYMIPSIITLSGIYVIGFLNPEIMNLFNTVTTLNIEVVKNVLYGGMLMYIVYLFIYYFIGKRLFEKGINVD